MDPASFELIREAWREALQAPAAFREPGVVVASRPVVAGEPSRVSVVSLGGATCVATSADLVPRLAASGAARLAEPGDARAVLGTEARVLGAAVLAFADRSTFLAPSHGDAVTAVPASAPALARLVAACDEADVDESAFRTWRHWISVVEAGGDVVAGAGAEVWSGTLAHIGVLARPERRGRGHARAAAGATVAQALAGGTVAQWRARVSLAASRRVAASLGFVELGSQVTYVIPDAGARPVDNTHTGGTRAID